MDINLIEPDPKQPRKLFDPDTLINSKNSISANSLLDPILVGNNEDKDGFFLSWMGKGDGELART
ncbi:MAG: hypothetical protein LBP95_03180 [Deltaproteobacteria bacterium]|jgi:ParB-like chromosome segregation protein Spo0J|nr:hypothetical protein [Deltaproteobacteria bacterium]